jgi:hypothetical protein
MHQENTMHTSEPSRDKDNGHATKQAPGGKAVNRVATVATSAALGGAGAGAIAGAIAGPVGAAVGAAIGAVAASFAGNSVAAAVEKDVQAAEAAYWRDNYQHRPYVDSAAQFDDYGPAYAWGVVGHSRHAGRSFDEVESELSREWPTARGNSTLDWGRARPATRDAWDRLNRGN